MFKRCVHVPGIVAHISANAPVFALTVIMAVILCNTNEWRKKLSQKCRLNQFHDGGFIEIFEWKKTTFCKKKIILFSMGKGWWYHRKDRLYDSVFLSPSYIVKGSILLRQGYANKVLCKRDAKLTGVR